MSCGGEDHYLRMELLRQCEAKDDIISIIKSVLVLKDICIYVLKNVVIPMKREKTHLVKKITMFQRLSKSISNLNGPPHVDNAIKSSKPKIIWILNKMSEKVNQFADAFAERLNIMFNDWTETEVKWESERPEESEVEKMTKRERKILTKLWKERELIAAEGKAKFEDLKAEWDAEKGSLDKVVMDCLRGVAELKE
ncbi:unnamed protein product [Orchesella dallaii]|uniref:Uncharacterized protein n=1 Tax=Orchesella dallaii TaxID=48710 RepID=A0ABP1S167_9HEXA